MRTVSVVTAALSVPLSVDTRRASVARAALDAGAEIVNDVSGLSDPGMADVVAAARAGVVVMHMRGTPQTMQSLTDYGDVVDDVAAELSASLDRAAAAGVGRERIVVENVIRYLKIFWIVAERYRNRRRRFGLRFNLIAGLYNFELTH